MELTWLSYCLTFKYMVHGRAKKCKKAPQILVISQYEAYMPLHVPGTKCCCQTYTRFKCACLLWAFQVGWINNQEILWMKRLLYNGVCVCVRVCVNHGSDVSLLVLVLQLFASWNNKEAGRTFLLSPLIQNLVATM